MSIGDSRSGKSKMNTKLIMKITLLQIKKLNWRKYIRVKENSVKLATFMILIKPGN